MAVKLMVQGTMSNAGKSLVAAGLCRIFHQDGYRAAPFKSQNMALNSYITKEGLEMGRAQVMQAEAACVEPVAAMNPILLKPTSDVGSQVIVNGKSMGNMSAREYFQYKKKLVPVIQEALDALDREFDIIVIEGAGSPAEINLKQNDIVNMGIAKMADAPVLLVGDIDRGGVFAQLYGTVELLEPEERARIKGLVINKFRGDKTILDPGITMLEEKCHIPVVGTIPYMKVDLDDEDSLAERLEQEKVRGIVDIAVVRLPHISNFTDFHVLEAMPGVTLRYVSRPRDFKHPDLIILPGTKNTIGDLKAIRQNGMEASLLKAYKEGIPIFGICGGYQMLGDEITDEDGTEGGGSIRGMNLLPMRTRFMPEKTRLQVSGCFGEVEGVLHSLSGMSFEGYEIHMGISESLEGELLPTLFQKGHAYGCYVHGVFDAPGVAERLVETLAEKAGVSYEPEQQKTYAQYKEEQYEKLAEGLRNNMDMAAIYEMLGLAGKERRTHHEH